MQARIGRIVSKREAHMPKSTTLEPPVEETIDQQQQQGDKKPATGQGGRSHRRGGGGKGTEGDQGGHGNPIDNDVNRLVEMLTSMREILELTVNHDPPLVPRDLRSAFQNNWPDVDGLFGLAIGRLRRGTRFSNGS
jgi:hypothetical protein